MNDFRLSGHWVGYGENVRFHPELLGVVHIAVAADET